MPNRIIREGILTSEAVSSLGWAEEIFYRRLLSVIDDYGRYFASPKLLRAACYPLQIDKVSDSDIGKWLAACATAALVRVYPAQDGKTYLEVQRFNQQIRSNASKFPAPPKGLKNSDHPNESDVETLLETHIQETRSFFGLMVFSVRRQVRVGDSYIDLLLETSAGRCVVELKRGNLTDKNLSQISRYVAAVPDSFGVLIGAAVGPRMKTTDATESDIALCEFTEELIFSVAVPSRNLVASEFTVSHGKSRAHLDVSVSVIEDVSVVVSEKKNAKAPPPFELPDWINQTHWDAWHSCPKRKKATDAQKQLAVDKLNAWREAGIDHAAALENAAIGGWQGLFKPDDKRPTSTHQQAESFAERDARVKREAWETMTNRKWPTQDLPASARGQVIDVEPDNTRRIA